MNDLIAYIITFLLGEENKKFCKDIGYTDDEKLFSQYKIVIKPAAFFQENVYDKESSLPSLPLQEIEDIPLLFGSPTIEIQNNTIITNADIIASSFFLITRYEEYIRKEVRDVYGRFPGKESLPYRADFIHRPIVDEYADLLRRWLRSVGIKTKNSPKIRKIWLTHDIDSPFFCRTFRSFIRESLKGVGWKKAFQYYTGDPSNDPFNTFDWLIQQDNTLRVALGEERCESIFFVKGGGKGKEDKPFYKLHTNDIQKILQSICDGGATIGLHSSFLAGINPSEILAEQQVLTKNIGGTISYNRHHYLSLREPEETVWLEKAAIKGDFTMGYADVAGFRLGTTHPVHWINPKDKTISPLLLYPLTVMDVTLSDPKYMNFDQNQALDYCLALIDKVEKHHGDLVLLWHNDTVTKVIASSWHRELYVALINELKRR